MIVTFLFFGATAEATGARDIAIELPEDSVAGDALDLVLGRYPELSGRKLHIAVNEDYADRGQRLFSGDKIAIFTAVSGG